MKNNVLHLEEKQTSHFTSTRNACKLCSPLGASIVFRGIEGCVPLIHGSQGCSTYIRRYIISHFREPIDIASSNFSEESAIFGGGNNLKMALDNLKRQYGPSAIGIATTCLSETIGDDVHLFLDQYRRERVGQNLPILFHASTPSYRGTHMDGFTEAVNAVVKTLAHGGERTESVNLIPGFCSAEDLRYLKEIVTDFGFDFTLLPDYSETLDGESWEEYRKLSSGGTPIESVRQMGRALATIQFGDTMESKGPGSYLEEGFQVPAITTDIPIGIGASDRFFSTLADLKGMKVPEKYDKERGRLIDAYIDGHKYIFEKRVAVFGEADLVSALVAFLDEIGIKPVLCATGAATGSFEKLVQSKIRDNEDDIIVVEDTDFATMLDICRDRGVDMIIGNSKGYYLSRKLDVPLVRVGFPIHDRIGGQRLLHIGYKGTQQLFDRIVNSLLEIKQEESSVGYSYI